MDWGLSGNITGFQGLYPPKRLKRQRELGIFSLGDWEGDTVVSAGHKGGLLTVVERKTQLAKITKLPRATARATTGQALASHPGSSSRSSWP
jgi:IS30 family transposase